MRRVDGNPPSTLIALPPLAWQSVNLQSALAERHGKTNRLDNDYQAMITKQ